MQQQTPMFMPQVVINAFLLFIFIINLLYYLLIYFYYFLAIWEKVLFCHYFDYFIILLSPPLTY